MRKDCLLAPILLSLSWVILSDQEMDTIFYIDCMTWLAFFACITALYLVSVLSHTWGLTRVMASNGKMYWVRAEGDRRSAAEHLAELEGRVNRFVEFLKQSRHAQEPRVKNVIRRWSGSLSEVGPVYTGEAAYSLNKTDVKVCIRDSSGRLQDHNTGMFVMLHELAHLAEDTYGHGESFWDTFRFLLTIAIEEAGVYEYQGFEQSPVEYCHHVIRSNPYTCVKRGSC
jgi:hypothetical protein